MQELVARDTFRAVRTLPPGWRFERLGFSEDTESAPVAGPPLGVDNPGGAPLVALLGGALARRFYAWTAGSGERYVCSVFELDNCPSFVEAVVLAVRATPDGGREIIAAADTGRLPELLMDEPLRGFVRARGANEWHVHLLCDGAERRRAVIADLLKDH